MTTTLTHRDVLTDLGISLAGIADPDAEVPVMENLAAQGDLLPRRIEKSPLTTLGDKLDFTGISVVGGESRGGNAHIVHIRETSAVAYFARVTGERNIEGILTVEAGRAYLTHTEEHGTLAIPTGVYELRQRTERERRVQD